MPLSTEKDCRLTEAEIVNFLVTRAKSSLTTVFKKLPKLSSQAKEIVNIVKA